MSGKSDAWMPLYIGDYLRDTGHLTGAEHGAYLLLLMQAWTRGGGLPTDDERLRHLARMDRREWAKARPAVLAFFYEDGGALRNRRMEIELARSQTVAEKRRSAGLLGAEKRWNINGTSMANGIAEPLANASQNDGQSQSQSHQEDSLLSPLEEGGKGVSPGKPDEPPAAPPARVPRAAQAIPLAVLQDMAAIWNEMAAGAGLPQCSELTAKRQASMRARIAERWKKDPLGKWRAYCQAIAAAPFLRGENDRSWRANIDWALRPGSPVAVAEGKYGDEEQS
ncbi:YdaU family protein [Falsiroseomonas tokyonensis]|uniref:YdaU family protein n=1 Tax=Falsiroseomonas tokyonensis TaxID=430521 RepID=A0ABV7C0N4_9PROT|nr:DUF1376 domain-containing protein [Falsiroseomonas tokyonensis]MBU8540214.1 YdaU family protein [Falsiroseomonas tokyonensis]